MATFWRFSKLINYVPTIIRQGKRLRAWNDSNANYFINMSRRYLGLNYCLKQEEKGRLPDQSQHTLYLSDTCVKQLLSVADTSDTMLRVTVEGGGCSGFQYKFNLDTSINKDDKIFERDGARVVIDELSLSFLSGSTIDYYQEMIRSSFRVTDNPNMEMGCSCGCMPVEDLRLYFEYSFVLCKNRQYHQILVK